VKALSETFGNVSIGVSDASFQEEVVPSGWLVGGERIMLSVLEGTLELHERLERSQNRCVCCRDGGWGIQSLVAS
jgi:hypothetical protein